MNAQQRVFIAYAILFTLNSASTVVSAAFLHTDWSTLTPTEKVVVLAAMVANWSGTMLAFVSKIGSKVGSNLVDS